MTKSENIDENDSQIPRPNSLLVGPFSQLRAPSSLLSGALPPGLLQEGGETATSPSSLNSSVASRPRRLWTIQDTAPKRIPKGFPPLNPQCTAYVGDASPSVLAVRISECLRKRSIAVEYDDENVSSSRPSMFAKSNTAWSSRNFAFSFLPSSPGHGYLLDSGPLSFPGTTLQG